MPSNLLMVPIRLDALCLSAETLVREPLADFSKLPFAYKDDDGTEHNRDATNLGEIITSAPYSPSLLRLEPGIHLHWALPDALVHSTQSNDQGARRFPIVPNRWLLTRSRRGTVENRWVIESDYVYPDLCDMHGEHPPAVTIPFHGFNRLSGPYQPYRYLGRACNATSWLRHDVDAEYLATFDMALTGVGPFEWVDQLDHWSSSFAALYPNCRSVFGFHDPDPNALHDPQHLVYDLVGWYANSDQDFLRRWLQANPQGGDPAKLATALANQCGWSVTLDSETFPDRMACTGRLSFDATSMVENPAATDRRVGLALGYTGAEALSATLAGQIAPGQERAAEEQLEAFQLGPSIAPGGLDLGARFGDARHNQGFTPHSGGLLWRAYKSGSDPSTASEVSLPDDLAAMLSEVNSLQQRFDQANNRITSMGERAFGDWCWLLRAMNPDPGPQDVHHTLENSETALLAIQAGDLNPLRAHMTETGAIEWTIDQTSKQVIPTLRTLAIPIAAYPNKYFNENEGTNYTDPLDNNALGGDDSWQDGTWPSELASFGLELSPSAFARQDQPGAPYTREGAVWSIVDGITYQITVEGGVMRLHIPPLNEQLAYALVRRIDSVRSWITYYDSDLVVNPVAAARYWQANNPVLLMQGPSVTRTSRHDRDGELPCAMLTNVAEGDLENLPHAAGLLARLESAVDQADPGPAGGPGFNRWTMQPWNPLMFAWDVQFYASGNAGHERPYRGFGVLSAHTGLRLANILAAYLVKQNARLPEPWRSNLAGKNTSWAKQYLDANVEALRLAYPTADASDPVSTAAVAYTHLVGATFLSQAMAGFNDALLVQDRALQLPLTDPTAFDEYRLTGTQLGGVLRDVLLRSPQLFHDFTPFCDGDLRITGLRLIDSFGRFNDLKVDPSKGCTIAASELFPKRVIADDDHRYGLAQRFVQPARLTFNWLSATTDAVEGNNHPATSPVCGWILPNLLDRSLMVYASAGELLGLIDQQAQWQAAPGSSGVELNQIPNRHLRRMIDYLNFGNSAAAFIDTFVSTIEATLEQIEPASFAQHQALALLMGRPMALVRTRIQLELQGLPASDKSFAVFKHKVDAYDQQTGTAPSVADSPDWVTHGFQRRNCPVQIGEPSRLDDGLVGYWVEDDDGSYHGNTFCTHADVDGYPRQEGHATSRTVATGRSGNSPPGTMPLELSATSPARTLAMLVDVRGRVHVRSGILPINSLALPIDDYAEALRKLEITFLTAPIVTARQPNLSPDAPLRLPLPKENGRLWSWLDQRGEHWNTRKHFGPTEEKARFSQPCEIREGWLKTTVPREGAQGDVSS